MKNKLTDLNDHLFAQIERLSDEDINSEDLQKEVTRSSALINVSDQIIKNAALSLKAAVVCSELGDGKVSRAAPMIEAYKNGGYKDEGTTD